MPTTAVMETRFRTVAGVRIRYAESDGPRERTVVLTSPWPESVYAFAPMWSSLAEHARLFAIDLPGFGASERRADLLSPQAMGGFLTSLIAEADLGRPHLVGPDVGTSAALLAAAGHPERIASVIVGTGGAAVPLQLGEPLASPVTIINGRHDRVVPLANAEFLDERLPDSRLAIIDAGHFVWEEAPAEYASIVLDSIT
jgi:pimeloyl-ACP methyl ester carboxylesterase